ncbi:hypothetical protein K440DRAFT_43697 [Wilcoxina mikolae CBS 423.85]|nr:hypothetical protein K440DRAFT_43697 [Wilcoxina mikolae CBS 423.85]
MLDTPDLKDLATEKLQIQLKNWVAADFPAMVKEIYSTTNKQDKKIRNVLVTAAKEHIGKLLELEEFKEVAEEFGEFSAALLGAVMWYIVSRAASSCRRNGARYLIMRYLFKGSHYLETLCKATFLRRYLSTYF